MRIVYYQPAPELAKYIRCYWTLESYPGEKLPALFPGTSEELICNLADPFVLCRDNAVYPVTQRAVLSLRRSGCVIKSPSAVSFIAVRFRAGGFVNFTPLEIYDLDGEIFCPDIFFENDNFLRVLSHSTTIQNKINILDELFIRLLRRYEQVDEDIRYAVNELFYRYNTADVCRTADYIGLGIRTFERRFRKATGFAPRNFIGYGRFHHTLKGLILGRQRDYRDAVLENGYYDQSHFIRVFKTFMGSSPGTYLNEINFSNNYYAVESGS